MTAWSSTAGAEEGSSEHSALLNAVRVVRERWWLILVSAVVCFVVTLGLSLHAQKQYTATASLLVKPSNLPAVIAPSQAEPTDPTTLARVQSDDVSLVTSSTIAAAVKKMLHTSESVADLQAQVQATVDANNDIVDVSVIDSSPDQAAAKANAFTNALVSYLTASAQAQLVAGQAKLQHELARLSPNNPSRTALQQGLEQVIALQAVTDGGAQVVQTAGTPTSPSSPKVRRNAAIGLVAGVLLGLALAFLLDLFDRRIKSAEALERLYGLPAIGSVPLRRKLPGDLEATHVDLEPYRILRDALGFISLREQPKVIFVTSAVSGEGKTSVAGGLARAMAAAGKSVALIEGDVHRPALRQQLGIVSNGRGLMNALVEGGSNAVDLVKPAPALPSLSVLSSGPFTPNSAELLRLPAMNRVLEDLAGAFDFVVIDGPPLLPVADAQVLLRTPAIDVVLIVGRPYLTTREDIRGAVAVLKRYPEKGFGLVVNAVRENPRGYNDYRRHRDDHEVDLDHDVVARGGSHPGRPTASTGVRRVPRSPAREDLESAVDPRSEKS
ncbi:MAG TPA: P-loop NTPase [Solirubrobacteraceae bacterium]|nr:P-loop NTPase [Solirubrobacteraceae bacterium]